MRPRLFRMLPLVLCLGCTALTAHSPEVPPASAIEEPSTVQVAEKPAPAPSAASAVDPSQRLLREAAKHLDDGDDAAALPCLASYVEANPDHAVIRTHLAELLIKQKRDDEARVQLERYVADAQEQGEPATRHLVHAHTRLVEIAERAADGYEEHLNRGIGLFRLAEQVQSDATSSEEVSVQAMLFKAIAELKLAAKDKPDEARPHWYLSEAWSHLGQSQPASASLRRARKLAILGGLTATESQSLALSR